MVIKLLKDTAKFLFSEKGAFLLGSVFAGFAWWINYVSTEYLSTPTLTYDYLRTERVGDQITSLKVRIKNISRNYKFEKVFLEFELPGGSEFKSIRLVNEGTHPPIRDPEKASGNNTRFASYTLENLHPDQSVILLMTHSGTIDKVPSLYLGNSEKAVRLLKKSCLTSIIEYGVWLIFFVLLVWLLVVLWISYARRSEQ